VSVPSLFSSNTKSERTEVLYGTENTTNTILNFLFSAQYRMDICADSTWPSVAMGIDVFKQALINIKDKGIKSKYLSEITKDNLSYCKEVMKIGELRHLDGIKGNFAVSEKEYIASATMQEGSLLQQVIYSNVKELLEQQQYVFDSFWSRSVPAEQKIKEIEQGIVLEFYDIIADRKKAAQILVDLAQSIKKQALILLPNDKSMVRLNRLGVIDYTIKASQEEGAEVKIICPLSEVNSEIVKKISSNAPNITILNGNDSSHGLYIVDGEKFFRAELRQPNAETLSESIGYSFYSNSKLSVESFKSVFELLWKQHSLNEELRRADKMQKEFINIAAHELRTPVQPIIGLSEVVLHNTKDIEQAKLLLEVINRNAKRLHRLTEGVLDVTKIESQSLSLNKEQFNIKNLISNAINDIVTNKFYFPSSSSSKSNSPAIELLHHQEDDIFVYADKERVSQVIYNLLDNAIKFTRGEGAITVIVEQEQRETRNNNNQQALISIKDTGTGIDSEILPRLFTKFATKSQTGGTGLGLFICKGIIEAHGGKIWAENNADGKGAIFTFSLPIVKNK
jgi:two-component system, OmpR family, sensor histidine kinase VicK